MVWKQAKNLTWSLIVISCDKKWTLNYTDMQHRGCNFVQFIATPIFCLLYYVSVWAWGNLRSFLFHSSIHTNSFSISSNTWNTPAFLNYIIPLGVASLPLIISISLFRKHGGMGQDTGDTSTWSIKWIKKRQRHYITQIFTGTVFWWFKP